MNPPECSHRRAVYSPVAIGTACELLGGIDHLRDAIRERVYPTNWACLDCGAAGRGLHPDIAGPGDPPVDPRHGPQN